MPKLDAAALSKPMALSAALLEAPSHSHTQAGLLWSCARPPKTQTPAATVLAPSNFLKFATNANPVRLWHCGSFLAWQAAGRN